MRNGERLPAPAVVDVSISVSGESSQAASETASDATIGTSAPAAIEQPKFRDVDVNVHADAGPEDAVPATTVQVSALAEDKERWEPKE
jgi:hypothetical protein